jgi:hypothetical protein
MLRKRFVFLLFLVAACGQGSITELPAKGTGFDESSEHDPTGKGEDPGSGQGTVNSGPQLVCDRPDQLDPQNPRAFARAMEMCDLEQSCDQQHPCPDGLPCVQGRCSLVLSVSFNDGSSPGARAVAQRFSRIGSVIPKAGQSFIVLSTGLASYEPQQSCPQLGTEWGNQHTDPEPGIGDTLARDYVELALQIRVPANARSFDFNFQFFSAEYPEWLGSNFNDTFWVQLESEQYSGNISFDINGTPIRINNAFFDICDPDPDEPLSSGMCTRPASQLDGTGFGHDCKESKKESENDSYIDPRANGGSTGWLHTSAPVTPGETIRLVFSIFDKGDEIYDSTVLIDNFRWQLEQTEQPFTGVIE